jgi:serine/threonine-protein kinase HipA
MPDGGWGKPIDGTPSTHILKPEIRGFPDSVVNEAFCMRLAGHLGLPSAEVEVIEVSGRPMLLVARYDRVVHDDGRVERIHQEDLCQAFGVLPAMKYEDHGGSSLRAIANMVAAIEPKSLFELLRMVVLHVMVGNGDAHAKNHSLLHETSGAIRLAPVYDVMSTLFYKLNRLAMYIDNVKATDEVTADRILNEFTSWGLSKGTAAEALAELTDRAPAAIAAARAETPGLPAAIPRIVRSQLSRLAS